MLRVFRYFWLPQRGLLVPKGFLATLAGTGVAKSLMFCETFGRPSAAIGLNGSLSNLGRCWGGQKPRVLRYFWLPQRGPWAPRGSFTLAGPGVARASCFARHLATPALPIGLNGPLRHLSRPWGCQRPCVLRDFWLRQRGPLAPLLPPPTVWIC